MKFNKWTLGLAALGVVSLASAVNAEEKTYLETAVSGTQISGYVSTSAHWSANGQNDVTAPNTAAYGYNGGAVKANGFNLDAVKIQIQKPLDETEWASGFNVELVYGQDAAGIGNIGGTAGAISPEVSQFSGLGISIKQAYVAMRTPVGNGIDWKIGVFDAILGYESFDAGNNPNYTRSYGYAIEPTTHTGILASYKFTDWLSVQAGIANTRNTVWIYDRATSISSGQAAQSRKTYMGSLALTAPQSWGVLAGSTLYGGVVKGMNVLGSGANDFVNYYAGTVVNTGIKGFKVGASYDYLGGVSEVAGSSTGWANAVALYGSFQATEKLSLHARGEYFWQDKGVPTTALNPGQTISGIGQNSVYALTGTIQYDLWKNVISRLEIRWDMAADTDSGSKYGSNANLDNAVLVAANLIYKF